MALRTRYVGVVAVTAALVVGLVSASGSGVASASVDGLSLITVKHSLLGSHTWFQQTYHGLPVVGGYYAAHRDNRTGNVAVTDGRLSVGGPLSTPHMSANEASAIAVGRVGGSVLRADLVILPGAEATLAWEVITEREDGTTRTRIAAGSGGVLSVARLDRGDAGTARVFLPNPVVATQNESLVDKWTRILQFPVRRTARSR